MQSLIYHYPALNQTSGNSSVSLARMTPYLSQAIELQAACRGNTQESGEQDCEFEGGHCTHVSW